MVAKASSGFMTRILGSESFESIFNGGAIYVYSGERPATPNDAPSGALLARVTGNGYDWTPTGTEFGMTFFRAGPYALRVPESLPWLLYGLQDGVAGWARLMAPGDPLGPSFDAPRLDFEVVEGDGYGLALPDTNIRHGASRDASSFLYTLYPVA